MPAAVALDNVSKSFRVYRQRTESLKEALLHRRRGVYDQFWALKDVSFSIEPGTTVGIIGSNGSGKSTTLKLMARILYPNAGQIAVRGRLSALLELGTGFHPDYTGRENIFLNGALLGLRREVIRRRLDDIIGFADIHGFIDNPVKTYSSGMYMRLGFAIAVNVDPDVLLIDEVLAVGDADFAQKCYERINRFRSEGKTIVLVSHDLAAVRRFCDRTIWIDRGSIRADGSPADVTERYVADVQHHVESDDPRGAPPRGGTREVEIARVELLGPHGEPQYLLSPAEPLTIRISYNAKRAVPKPVFRIAILSAEGVICYETSNKLAGKTIRQIRGSGSVSLAIPQLNLLEGGYLVSVTIVDEGDRVTFDHWDRRVEFRVRQRGGEQQGLVYMAAHWSVNGEGSVSSE